MNPTREQIGRILYECEKKRGEHADAVMKGISPKASDALLMEPWEECKESFLGDADAVLELFRSAAITDDALFNVATEAWSTQTDASWSTDGLEAAISAVREALAAAPTSPEPPFDLAAFQKEAATWETVESETTCKDSLQVQSSPEPDAVREIIEDIEINWRVGGDNKFSDAQWDIIKGCLNAALSAPVSGAWQDISTAPKDGSRVQLFHEHCVRHGEGVVHGRWYVHPSVAGWLTDEFDCNDYEFEPTHWKPVDSGPLARNDGNTGGPRS